MGRVMLRALLVLAVLLAALPALAENKGRNDRRARVEKRIQQLRTRVLKQEVGLDDKKADEVQKVLVKHHAERQKLQREHRQHRKDLRDLLQSDSNDEARYKKSIEGFRSTQKKLNALRDREMDEIQKLVTSKQQAKLYAAMERLRRKLARRARGGD
jgi:Spy/CpxP family protein refolding chaperone